MRGFAVTVLFACLALIGGLRADDRGQAARESAQAVLDGVAKMAPADQQAWLKGLEERAIKAAGQALKPDDAAKEQARIRELLHQRVVTWQVLRAVLEETQAREAKLAGPASVPTAPKPPAAKPQPDVVAKPRPDAPRPEHVKQAGTVKSDAGERHENGVRSDKREPIEVNVEELEARIAGSNLGFRTIENELDDKGVWDAARLEPLGARLRVLVVRHGDLTLFRNLLPAERRSTVTRLEGPRSAISEFGARISEARKAAQGEDFKGTESQRRAELERLEALSRRLAELEAK
jgi:hypothetical protein